MRRYVAPVPKPTPARRTETVICPCGATFERTVGMPHPRKYCSRACPAYRAAQSELAKRGRAKTTTKEAPVPRESCVHHFDLEPKCYGIVHGICQKCKTERDYRTIIDEHGLFVRQGGRE